jgi:hypothetical protein
VRKKRGGSPESRGEWGGLVVCLAWLAALHHAGLKTRVSIVDKEERRRKRKDKARRLQESRVERRDERRVDRVETGARARFVTASSPDKGRFESRSRISARQDAASGLKTRVSINKERRRKK